MCRYCARVERVVRCEECEKCGAMMTQCGDHALHRHVLVSVQSLGAHEMMVICQVTMSYMRNSMHVHNVMYI